MPNPINSKPSVSQLFLAALFLVAGALHFISPQPYERIVPPVLPFRAALVYLSGAAELLGGAGVLVPRTRRAAGLGLVLLLIAVFPANVQMLLDAKDASLAAKALLWLRLPLQGALIFWAWRATQTENHSN